jgi:hypothetical protein
MNLWCQMIVKSGAVGLDFAAEEEIGKMEIEILYM